MHIILSGVRTCQKYFRPHVLTAFILIYMAAAPFVEVNGAQHVNNVGSKLLSQDYLTLATPTNRPTHRWQPTPTTSALPTPTASAVPTPTPSPVGPTPTPNMTSSNGNGVSPSGQDMPGGDLPGWHQIFAQDFNSNVSLGNFPGSAYGSPFTAYPDGTRDTAGKQGAPSRYYPSKVVSVWNGTLNMYLHTENGTPMAATILPTIPGNHLYGKYTIRFRADALPGFKVAWLLWPDSGNWPYDGEIDFPESGLDGTIGAFVHHQNGTWNADQDAYTSTATYTSWHTASIEWSPNKVNFILDGQSIGTSTNRIPATPMHWVIQSESCLPTCPAATTAGYIQIDWMVAYAPA